jgi:uroporphyrinogen decarboxylase
VLPLRGVSELVEETEEWSVRRNGAGAALKYWKHKSGTPEHIDFRMTSREIWDRDYRPHLLELDRARIDIEGTKRELARRREQGLWTHFGHLFIWENMRQSMGDVCMYESLLLDPAWIHDYNRVHTDFFKAHYKLLLDEAGPPDGVWVYEDLGYRNGLFCSPKVYEELIFPYYRELVEFFHARGLPVVLHSCGNITEAMPMIVAAGFDALHPCEVKAGCDILRFAEQYGDKLAFIGGLDVRVLESHDRGHIHREVVRLIGGMKERGARFLFGTDHSVSTNVDYADYVYALEVYRENMMY